MSDSRLAVELPGLTLKNPIMPASGTFGFGDVGSAKKFDLNQLGALVIKTATVEPRTGNPDPKIAVIDNGVLNAVGLQNPGIEAVVNEKLAALKEKYPDLPIIGSIGGSTVDDYIQVAKKLSASKKVAALELNISCPNVHEGGMAFGTKASVAEDLTKRVKDVVDVPVYVKLTPNVTDVVEIAQAVATGGADGLSMINTVLGMHIDVKTRKPVLGNVMGGFSGHSIKPIAIRMIYQVSQVVDLPIIGMGGVESADDVIEMFLAGASAVAIGTAHFKDPLACPHIIDKLPAKLDELGITNFENLREQVRGNRHAD